MVCGVSGITVFVSKGLGRERFCGEFGHWFSRKLPTFLPFKCKNMVRYCIHKRD